MSLDDLNGVVNESTDDIAFNVLDIAKYVLNKYNNSGEILLETIYYDLDRHPVFPSEGYKEKLKNTLKDVYGLKINQKSIIF